MDRTAVEGSAGKQRTVRRRRSLFPSTVLLLLAIVALLTFIGIMGDARRTRNALQQAEINAAAYAQRAAQTKVLPLNLEPDGVVSSGPRPIDFEWLPSDQVRVFRQTSEPVLVAWSVPVLKFFGQDGRAAIFFRGGAFEVRWMSEGDFEQARLAQHAMLGRLGSARP
jgi:hypothetical protein